MNRLRRISVRVEQREVSVSITQTTTISGEPGAGPTPKESGQPGNCPDCGAPWLPDLSTALRDAHISLEVLRTALLENRVHLQNLPGGLFRVCERSFKTIKETNR
jgi:hypothetical protein